MRRSFALLVAALCALAAWTAHADLLLERAYFRDDSGRLDLEEIRSAPFTHFTGVLSQGYSPTAVYWLRLRIPGGDPASGPRVLRVHPGWHDDVQLHDTADPRASRRVSGDRHPWSDSEFPSLSPAFLLKNEPVDRYVFLRVQSIHSYQIDTELLELAQAERSEWRRMMALSVYISGMALVLLWALSSLLLQTDRTVAAFALTQFAALLYSLLMFGMGRVMLDGVIPSAWLDQAHVVVLIGYVLTALQFYSMLLRNHGVARWAGRTVTLLAALPLASFALYLCGRVTVALSLNALNLAAFCIAAFVAAWFGAPRAAAKTSLFPRAALRIFFSLILLIGLAGTIPLIGWAKASTLTQLIFLVHGPLLTAIIGSLLVYRARARNSRQAGEIALANARTEQERLARLEQSQFMAMINHEVKTPLSVLKMLVAGQSIQRRAEAQVDTVVALLDRCVLYDQLSSGKSRIRKERFLAADLTQQCIARTGDSARFDVRLASTRILESDPVLYAVIVGNLLDNALKYAAPASRIRVIVEDACRDGGSFMRLSVTNTIGRAGMPDRERIFEKYYRAESARFVPGTGLGLYLVKSLARMLGGDALCASDSDTIRFEICLPH